MRLAIEKADDEHKKQQPTRSRRYANAISRTGAAFDASIADALAHAPQPLYALKTATI